MNDRFSKFSLRMFLAFPFLMVGFIIMAIGFLIRFGLIMSGDIFAGFAEILKRERKNHDSKI